MSGRASSRKRRASSGVGRHAERVEVGAAQEHAVGTQVRRLHPQRPQLGEDGAVDVVVLGRVVPDEAGPGGNERQLHGRLAVEVAHQDGRLAESPADGRRRRDRRGRPGWTARRRPGRSRRGSGRRRRSPVTRSGTSSAGSASTARAASRRGVAARGVPGGSSRQPVGDPAAEDAVFARADGEALAAFVGTTAGRLEEHQAVVGVQPVGAAGERVARQDGEVEVGVLAAEGELEAVLAVLVAVAGALRCSRRATARP